MQNRDKEQCCILREEFVHSSCVLTSTGSPFTVEVTGEGRIRESINRRQKAASVASVGSVCDLSLKIPGTHTHTHTDEGGGSTRIGRDVSCVSEEEDPPPDLSSSVFLWLRSFS